MKTQYFYFFLSTFIIATDCYSQEIENLASSQFSDTDTNQSNTKSQKEILNMNDNMPSPSRPAPPEVEPIVYKDIRYEQDMQSYNFGGVQPGGYLVAIDPMTNKRLWMLKVYEVPVHDNVGVSTPGRYFRKMTLVAGRDEIEIENEAGGKYLVDLSKQNSAWISGPDSVHK